jgi:hypothetical protein
MSPGKRSPGLARPILEQTRSHPSVPKPTTEPSRNPSSNEHDLLVAQLEVDLVAWAQMRAITQRLRNHNLPLRANPPCHT